ncbi:MAG: RloB family protein [Prevotella sp.]
MVSKREKAPDKRMRKIALVICEGETEENYLNLIKKWYKSPVRIVSQIEGTRITQALVDKHERGLKISATDKVDTFLMYDMDVLAINEKLMACKAELLLSNPCFEIWLLLHAKNLKSALSTEAVLKELKRSAPLWHNYNKAAYTNTQKAFLREHLIDAIARSKALKDFQNPSSRIYKLLEILGDKRVE